MLIAAICIVFLAGYLISAWQRREYISPDDMVIQADAEQEYEEFIASLKEKEQHREKHYTTYKKQEENSCNPGFFQSKHCGFHHIPTLRIASLDG